MKPNFSSVLLTGASGFIGKYLLSRLIENKIKVICLVRNEIECLGSEWVQQICLPEFTADKILRALDNISAEVVFHLAAYGVNPHARLPLEMINVNLMSFVALLMAIKDRPPKQIIHIGTCSEYALAEKDQLINEAHPLHPWSIYGASKISSALYGLTVADQFNLPFIHLRLFGVYGPGEASYRLAPSLIQKLLVGEKVELSPGRQIRDFLYVEDVVDALIAAGNLPPQRDIFNICSSYPISVRDFALQVGSLMVSSNNLLNFGALDYRVGEPMWLVGDNRKFCKMTAWKPMTSLKDGLTRMIANGRKAYHEKKTNNHLCTRL